MTSRKKIEFGDFQTPEALAGEVAALLCQLGVRPDFIVEPTCGTGSFVRAVVAAFPRASAIYGFDVNSDYVRDASVSLDRQSRKKVRLECQSFFEINWPAFFADKPGRILVIGNPPWVTNSALSTIRSDNLPEKSNFQGHKGFAAKTGKANFDISEWMLIRLLEAVESREGSLVMLCKTATARKVLRHAWINRLQVGRVSLHRIDALRHFHASVDACLLIVHTGVAEQEPAATIYDELSFAIPRGRFGIAGRELVANIDDYRGLSDFDGISFYKWRSGIKHDAAAVMEFRLSGTKFINGRDEVCDIESDCLYPLLKSSDVANGRLQPERFVLVTQRTPAAETQVIASSAPRTWAYLHAHAADLDRRVSIIYRKRSRFAIFGIGDYSFAPWKVAISGLYKNCRFQVVGTHRGKPVMLDDTCYFVPCASQDEAQFVCDLLNSDICQRFLRSLVFLDAKRPITIDVLNRIDLNQIAIRLGLNTEAQRFLSQGAKFENRQPKFVFENEETYGHRQRRRAAARRRR